MKNLNPLVKKIIISLIISISISLFIIILALIFFHNLSTFGQIISKNEYFVSYLEDLEKEKLAFPWLILLCITLINFIIWYLLFKHKVISIIICVLFSLVSIGVFIILTKLGDEYLFQYIESVQDYLGLISQFKVKL